jgi:hypothetical protein
VATLQKASLLCEDVPEGLRAAFQKKRCSSKALAYMALRPELRALIQTTTAVTVVHGGDKGSCFI